MYAIRSYYEQGGGLADDHINNGYGPFFRIGIGHGQGDSLTLFGGLENDKLPGLGLFGNQGSLNLRITSYNVCYTKLLRETPCQWVY